MWLQLFLLIKYADRDEKHEMRPIRPINVKLHSSSQSRSRNGLVTPRYVQRYLVSVDFFVLHTQLIM